jgi:arylsulfatase A-like enzyme
MPTVLIDVDSLRKDHLPFYGYSINTAPNLSELAEESAVFESFYADDTPSMPSRATIISGRTSLSHGVTSHHATDQIMNSPYTWNLDRKKEWEGDLAEWWNLPELLSFNDVETCLVSSFPRKPALWFNRTWNRVKQPCEAKTLTKVDAEEVTDRAMEFLRSTDEDFFLYVQYWDTHAPLPEKGLRAETPERPTEEEIGEHLEWGKWASAAEKGVEDVEDLVDLLSRYNRAIRRVDRGIGRIIRKLKRDGIYDETNIIVTADHGESFGEHGVYQEHWSVHEENQNVPLVIKSGKEGRFEGLCSTRDLAPTVAQMHGLESPEKWQGTSLIQRMEQDDWEESLLLHHGLYTVQRALIRDNWKLIHTLHPGFWDIPEYQLFELERGEHDNLRESEPIRFKEFREELESRIPEDDPYQALLEKGPAGYEYNKEFYMGNEK